MTVLVAGPDETGSAHDVDTARLFRAYRERGDARARQRLVTAHLALVRALARRYAGRGEPLEDIVQVGCIGLIKAIDRFDPRRGVEFTSYAVPTILGEIGHYLRDRRASIRIPDRLLELGRRVRWLADQLTQSLGRSPTIRELAAAAEIDEETVIEALAAGKAGNALPESALSDGAGSENSVLQQEVDDPSGDDERIDVTSGLRALDRRERLIVYLRFFEDRSQTEIAADLGISQVHVSRLLRHAIEKMRAELAA